MSEDTAHGQHYEPGNGAATPAQAQQAGAIGKELTLEQALDEQVNRVQQLVTRVGSLIDMTREGFVEFVAETAILFHTLQSIAQETRDNANRPTDRPKTQASA